MSKQFMRKYELIVGTLLITDLDIVAKVERSLKKGGSSNCELTIYNLNPQHRALLEATSHPVVQLRAGYKDNIGTIYLGDMIRVCNRKNQENWETTLFSSDGGKENKFARINRSFKAGTSLQVVLAECAKATKIKPGNLVQAAARAQIGGNKFFANGITVSGSTLRQFHKLLKSAGMEWSIQNGGFQVLDRGKSLMDTAVVLTNTSGLLEAPSIDTDGVVTLRALLNSDIMPGRQIVFKALSMEGIIRANTCTYDLDTQGDNWDVQVEGKLISGKNNTVTASKFEKVLADIATI